MKNLKQRLLLLLTGVLMFTLGAASTGTAYSTTSMQTVQAVSGVKILYNGTELTDTSQPYIINNTTYVPLRMLMNHFGDKTTTWDSAGYRVLITDNSNSLKQQLAQKGAELANVKAKLRELLQEIENSGTTDSTSYSNDISTSDIQETLNDAFGDAGDNYFNDSDIETTVNLSGDENDLAYTIKLDFDNANDYDNLTDIDQSGLKDFLDDVESKIAHKIDNTNYQDADITGKLVDNNYSSYYVKYNGSSYTYSWDENKTSVTKLKSTLNDYFQDAGDDYFGDDGIVTTVSLTGDENDIAYSIKLDFSNADTDNLSKLSATEIKSFLNDVWSKINKETDNTDFADASITGKLYDSDNSSYYVKYTGSSYTFSW